MKAHSTFAPPAWFPKSKIQLGLVFSLASYAVRYCKRPFGTGRLCLDLLPISGAPTLGTSGFEVGGTPFQGCVIDLRARDSVACIVSYIVS